MSSINYDSIWKLISLNKFVYQTDANLKCGICEDLLIDGCQSHCGCQFCYNCIHDFIGKFCPGNTSLCNDELLVMDKNILRNPMLNKKIAILKVNCPNQLCDSEIVLNEMENHLRLCTKQPIDCPYVALGCNTEPSNKDAVVIHLHNDVLVHTELLIELIENMKNEINALKEAVNVGKLENMSLKNDFFESRKDNEKNMDEQKGEILRLTMTVDDLRREIVDKAQKNSLEVSSLKNELLDLKNEMEKKINEATRESKINMNKQEEEIAKLRTTVDDERREIEEKSGKSSSEISSVKNELSVLRNDLNIKNDDVTKQLQKNTNERREEMARLTTTVDEVRREMREKSQEKENRIMSLEKELRQVREEWGIKEKRERENVVTMVDGVRNDISKMRDESDRERRMNHWIRCNKLITNEDACVIWRIEGCSKKIGKPIRSESFYSNNYKLSLLVVIQSDDNIALLCVINRGENDAEVKWPMKRGVTLSIIDQYTLETHETQTHKYDTYEGNKKAFDRPTSHMIGYCGIGSISFIKYSSIRDLASVVVDDSIIVSCVIGDP